MVCYEIVSGEIPFHDKHWTDYDIVIDGGRPKLPDCVLDILRNITSRCWHSNPTYQPSFGELLEALRRKTKMD